MSVLSRRRSAPICFALWRDRQPLTSQPLNCRSPRQLSRLLLTVNRFGMHRFPAHLLNGYRAFMAERYQPERDRYRALAQGGQSPRVMIIACCDSRAAPETVFNAGPGELFVLRN